MDPVSARVQELVDHSGLTQKEFAQKLNLNPAIISHILGGRNKPSLAVIQAITNVYTNVNLNYLLRGEGRLFKEEETPPPASPQARPETGTFDFQQVEGVRRVAPPTGSPLPQGQTTAAPSPTSAPAGEKAEHSAPTKGAQEEPQAAYKSEAPPPPSARGGKKTIARVIIFYTDHSLEEYRP